MKKILIVDDEPDILKIVNIRIRKAGYETTILSDSQEALDRMEEIAPDLLLLDIRMPVLTGPELCRRVKANPALRRIPVVLMTASSEQIRPADLEAAGAQAGILKPFEPEELLSIVKKLTE